MTGSKKTKTKINSSRSEVKKSSGVLKILEVVVIIGAIAGVLINFFKGKKNR